MTVQKFSLFLLLGVSILLFRVSRASDSNSSSPCDLSKCQIPKHYREIGCVPEFSDKDEEEKCCPVRFNCEEIEKQDKTKCHFRGKSFSEGERLPGEVSCRADCSCRDGEFNCANIECPEEVFDIPPPHCVIEKTPENCCSRKTICDEKEIKQLPVCHLGGREYRKGEEMYPQNDRCFQCYCDENFSNATEVAKNPNCKEVHCAIDLMYLAKIRSGCVPVYFGEPTCCPISLKCPAGEDKAIPLARSTIAAAVNENLKCKFGEHDLQIGDKISDSNKCIDCECKTPPMITCVQQRNC